MKSSFEDKLMEKYQGEMSQYAPDMDKMWDRIEAGLEERSPRAKKIVMHSRKRTAAIWAAAAIILIPVGFKAAQFSENSIKNSDTAVADNMTDGAANGVQMEAEENNAYADDAAPSVDSSPAGHLPEKMSYNELNFPRETAKSNMPEIENECVAYFVESEVLSQTDRFVDVKVRSVSYNEAENAVEYELYDVLGDTLLKISTTFGNGDNNTLCSNQYVLKIGHEYILPLGERDGEYYIVFPSAPQTELTVDGYAVFHNGWTSFMENETAYLECPRNGKDDYFYDRMAVTFAENLNFGADDDSGEGFTDKELDDMETVDEAIGEWLKNSQQMPRDERIEGAKELLYELASEGYIRRYSIYFDDRNGMFSFEYSCGVYGGIKIDPFDPMMN
ncbi:MAG: hypothetical protein J5999_00470 [Oscillospiraceae bacterium]|nr:hypothetical protein [Oscillospiraceae bacterium]